MSGLSVVLVGASIWCGYLAFRRTGEWLHPLTILLAEGFLLGTARREGFSLRRMRAPNPAWDELTQAYADLYELILMNLREGEDPERRAMIDRQGRVLKERREAL